MKCNVYNLIRFFLSNCNNKIGEINKHKIKKSDFAVLLNALEVENCLTSLTSKKNKRH